MHISDEAGHVDEVGDEKLGKVPVLQAAYWPKQVPARGPQPGPGKMALPCTTVNQATLEGSWAPHARIFWWRPLQVPKELELACSRPHKKDLKLERLQRPRMKSTHRDDGGPPTCVTRDTMIPRQSMY